MNYLHDNIHRLKFLTPSNFLCLPGKPACPVYFPLPDGKLDICAALVAFNELYGKPQFPRVSPSGSARL